MDRFPCNHLFSNNIINNTEKKYNVKKRYQDIIFYVY